mgnify:CR=1 FL=1
MAHYKTKAAAEYEARRVRRRLRGANWIIEVSRLDHSMPWYWTLHNGGLSLHESRGIIGPPLYWTLLAATTTTAHHGECYFEASQHHRDPNKAVAEQLANARAFCKQVNDALALLERNIPMMTRRRTERS